MSGPEMVKCAGVLVFFRFCALPFYGQQAPPSPDQPWLVSRDRGLQAEVTRIPATRATLDPNHLYTLPELADFAERNNPETRIVWERAKQRAAELGVARSALFPTVAALASASRNQYSLFFGKFYHEDTGVFPAILTLSYTILDFGARASKIDRAKADLLAADFTFNDAHRRIIFRVTEAYYRLLDAMAREDAVQAMVADTQTVQQAVEAKLANGLATLPDVLEARAASAQAQYELASVQGLVSIARGALATALGVSATADFHVENVSQAAIPETMEEPVQTLIERALAGRPDLLTEVARVRYADAEVKQSRSPFYPLLSFSGDWGHSNAFGQQNFGPAIHSAIFPYEAQIKLSWSVFDGGARSNELARAQAGRREAQAQVLLSRDQIENEIWISYSELKTAQKQQEAANALLQATEQSYSAASEAFQAGVRTFIDVTTAQRELARARTAQATARVRILTSLASLAFRVGDQIPAAQH